MHQNGAEFAGVRALLDEDVHVGEASCHRAELDSLALLHVTHHLGELELAVVGDEARRLGVVVLVCGVASDFERHRDYEFELVGRVGERVGTCGNVSRCHELSSYRCVPAQG